MSENDGWSYDYVISDDDQTDEWRNHIYPGWWYFAIDEDES